MTKFVSAKFLVRYFPDCETVNFPIFHYVGNNWENCVVELEQTGTPGEVDFGTLSVFGSKKNKVT